MFTDEQKLRQLTNVFLEENKKLNLSAFRTFEHCSTGNVLDSLAFLEAAKPLKELMQISSLLDMGTGGGFPLLPLALCLPHVACTGIDSTQKKMHAVYRMVEAMEMKNVTLRCGRLEEYGHQENIRASFDVVTARAVATIPVLLEYAAPFLKIGGIAALWKSDKIAAELASSANAQKLLGVEFLRTYEYSLGEKWGKRLILLFKKTKETPSEYPRDVGEPKQKPL